MSNLQDLLVQHKVLLWTIKKHAHPKTSRYWRGEENGSIVLDAEKVATEIESAKNVIAEMRAANKTILLVCEKQVVLSDVEEVVAKTWIHYFYTGTPSWIMTNFDTLQHTIKTMNKLESFVVSDDFNTLTKKEQLMKRRQLAKVQKIYKWVKNLRSKPDLVILVEGKMLSKFVDEVEKINAKSVVLANTDFDRYFDNQNLIVMNTKSKQSLAFVMNYIFGLNS